MNIGELSIFQCFHYYYYYYHVCGTGMYMCSCVCAPSWFLRQGLLLPLELMHRPKNVYDRIST